MKQHEREFFVARIRSGIVPVANNHATVYVHAPTMIQSLEAGRLAMSAYDKALHEGMMTQRLPQPALRPALLRRFFSFKL